MALKKVIKKEMRDWGIFIGLIAFLYFTGLHTDVAAFAQRVILTTGIFTPDTEIANERAQNMDYDFSITDMEGNLVPVTQFKDKVIFLNHWATWCPPCIAEMPGIQSLYDELSNHQDIAFIMLSVGEPTEKVSGFISRKEFTFPVYQASPGTLPDVIRSQSIPATYVISKSGKIVSKKIGMAKYNTNSFKKFLLDQADL